MLGLSLVLGLRIAQEWTYIIVQHHGWNDPHALYRRRNWDKPLDDHQRTSPDIPVQMYSRLRHVFFNVIAD